MKGGTIYGLDAGGKSNIAEQGNSFAGDRQSAQYGNKELILEGYRKDYVDNTLRGR
jgi:hypothetical protein